MRIRAAGFGGAVVVALFGVLCTGCFSTMRKHPDLVARRAKIVSVAVMPPQVEVVEHGFRGSGKRLRDDEMRATHNLVTVTTNALEERGFQIRKARLDAWNMKEEPELRFQTTQVQEAFGREMKEAYQRELMRRSKAFKYTHAVGPEVNAFAERAEVDALFFVRMSGFKVSTGQRTMDYVRAIALAVAVGGSSIDPGTGEGSVVQLGLVDGTTGDLLWSNMGKANDLDGESITHAVHRLIKGIPNPEEPEKKKPKDEKPTDGKPRAQ